MKKITALVLILSFTSILFSQESNDGFSDELSVEISVSEENDNNEILEVSDEIVDGISEVDEDSKKADKERTVVIPEKKRPLKPDTEKAEKAALKDEGKNAVTEKQETIAFGIESEILSLIKDLINNDDPRFSDDLYDLFYSTKSVAVREKILEYFIKQKDSCIEDYAVEVLQDPYDTKDSTVEMIFRYVSEVKTKEAIPCVLNLLESEEDSYFTGALTTIGEIGGEDEAPVLVEYLERDDLTLGQRQSLMKVLGRLKAESTWDKLSEICQDEEENSFVRMYAAEAIGAMKNPDSIPILVKLFESSDPNFRVYVIKGLSNYDTDEAKNVIIQGIRDAHWKVRQEAIDSCGTLEIKDSVPYIIYRAKNDPEKVIKDKSYEVLSKIKDSRADEFLVSQISDEKGTDTAKGKACEALLKNGTAGRKEISELALSIANDDKKKNLRYQIGKLIAKYPDAAFDEVSIAFMQSKDAQTCAIGIDMYASGRYDKAESKIKELSENEKAGANYKKARKVLKID